MNCPQHNEMEYKNGYWICKHLHCGTIVKGEENNKQELKGYISGVLIEFDKTNYDDREKLGQYYFTNKIIKLVEQYYGEEK